MASPTRLGVVTLAPGTSATPGAQSITVPTGATGAVAFWGEYGAFSGMTGLTCSFGSPNSANRHQTPSIGGTHNGTGLWAFDVSATGSQTITPVWSNAIIQGPALSVAFYKDLDANWKDSARFATAHNQYAAASGSVTAETDAEILVFETQDGGTAPSVPSGRTLVQNRSENAIGGVFYTVNSPTSGSNSISSGNTNFPGIAIASIKGASGGGGGVTGTLSATESGSDTAASSGVVVVQGALSASETGSDTAAIAGAVTVAGSLSANESGSDSAAISGIVVVSGSLSASETGDDTALIIGGKVVTGDLAAAEVGSDSAALSGVVLVQGSLIASESGSDTAVVGGAVLIQGALTTTEPGGDSAAIAGTILVQGALSVNETGEDQFAADGITSIRTGSMDAVELGGDSAHILGAGVNLNPVRGGGSPRRKGYIIKGQKYWLDERELAVLIAQMLGEVKREEIRIATKKPKVLSHGTWARLQESIQALEDLTTPVEAVLDNDEDDEEALLLLL